MMRLLKSHWTYITIAIVLSLIFCTKGVYDLRSTINQHPGKLFQSDNSAYLDYFLYFPICAFLRWFFDYLFAERIYERLRTVDLVNYEKKKVKVTKEAYNIIRYSLLIALSLYLFGGTPQLPSLCGGTISCEDMTFYTFTQPPDANTRLYIMLQLAMHSVTLFEFLYKNSKKKVPEFNEMFMHHCLSITMIIYSYSSSTFPFCITILFMSDISDFWLTLARFLRDMKPFVFNWLVETAVFAVTMSFWLYSRVLVVCYCTMRGAIVGYWRIITEQSSLFASQYMYLVYSVCAHFLYILILLSILSGLILYWTFMILEMAYHRIYKKEENFAIRRWGEKEKVNGKNNDDQKREKRKLKRIFS